MFNGCPWPRIGKKYLQAKALGPDCRPWSNKQDPQKSVALLDQHLQAMAPHNPQLAAARQALQALLPPRLDLAKRASENDAPALMELAHQAVAASAHEENVLIPLSCATGGFVLELGTHTDVPALCVHGGWGGFVAATAPACHVLTARNISWELPKVLLLLQAVYANDAAGACKGGQAHPAQNHALGPLDTRQRRNAAQVLHAILDWAQTQGATCTTVSTATVLTCDTIYEQAQSFLFNFLDSPTYFTLGVSFLQHVQSSFETWRAVKCSWFNRRGWPGPIPSVVYQTWYIQALHRATYKTQAAAQDDAAYVRHRDSATAVLGFVKTDLARSFLRQSTSNAFCIVPQDSVGAFHVYTHTATLNLGAALLHSNYPSDALYLKPMRNTWVGRTDRTAPATHVFANLEQVSAHFVAEGYAPASSPNAATLRVLEDERAIFIGSLRTAYLNRSWYCEHRSYMSDLFLKFDADAMAHIAYHPLLEFTVSFRRKRKVQHFAVPVDRLGINADDWRLVLPWRDGRGVRDLTELLGELPLTAGL